MTKWSRDADMKLAFLWARGDSGPEIMKALGLHDVNDVYRRRQHLGLRTRSSLGRVAQRNCEKRSSPDYDRVAHLFEGQAYPLAGAGHFQCRWPYQNMTCCGHGVVMGLPYCPDHASIAYKDFLRPRAARR